MRCDCRHDHGHRQLTVAVHFDRADLRMLGTPFGVVVELAGAKNGGAEGGPALPRKIIKVAVPPLQWPTRVSVERETFARLTEMPTFVAPVQRLRAGAFDESPQQAATDVGVQADRLKTSTCRPCPDPERDRQDFPEPFEAPPLVPPDPRLYADAVRSPRPLAVAMTIEQIGLIRIAQIELNPVRLTPEGHLELCTSCDVVVSYGDEKPLADKVVSRRVLEARLRREIDPDRLQPLPDPVVTSRPHARRLGEIARAEVINPDLVWEYSRHWPELYLTSEYLIITDDRTWNAQTITPGAPAPGLISAFERLAQWKSSRGVRASVVTISSIVSGQYGDHRTGARDLQEVIRRFLKTVVPRWGVSWVLLGGDVDIVPIRKVAGGVEGHMAVGADDPPKENTSFWTGTFLKMHAANPGTWWFGSTMNVLVRPDTGEVIPYDAAGTSNATTPGWFFTTSNSYATRTTMATNFVRVNGPAALVNGTLQWLYNWNTIPTDFYYSSLNSFVIADISFGLPFGGSFSIPYVWFPAHDWDALDNGIYGQHTADGDMDGVVLTADVSVGRAPVSTAAEAKAFVDKVKSYESVNSPFLVPLNPSSWPRRVVLASSNWGNRVVVTPSAVTPPADGRYHHAAGAPFSVIKLAAAPADFQQALIAEISDTDRRILPYSESVAPGSRGWHFAKSATDLNVNEFVFTLPPPFSMTIRFPMPSQWMVVFGPAAETAPLRFLIDQPGQDLSMSDQEALREQLRTELPVFNTFTRLYEDDLDLTPAQAGAAPVQYLTQARLTAALNASPHIVSLSGHGNSDGCCLGSVALAGGLTNEPPFIAYADSCLTNQVDAEDAFSEALLYNPTGGAVAYVGNTRFSWIGVGDNFQRAFFHRLTATRHLGLLNDSRVGLYGTTGYNALYDRWAVFALNLMGDPEMQVHKRPGRRLDIKIAGRAALKPIVVRIVEVKPPRPVPDPQPVPEALVHVRQRDRTFTATTDEHGDARLDLSTLSLGEVEITVSHEDFLPFQLHSSITGPAWVDGAVVEVSHREGGDRTSVRLRTEGGVREFIAHGDRADYRLILDAVENAYVSRESIALLVDSGEDGGAIERFRFRQRDSAAG